MYFLAFLLQDFSYPNRHVFLLSTKLDAGQFHKNTVNPGDYCFIPGRESSVLLELGRVMRFELGSRPKLCPCLCVWYESGGL